MSTLLYRSVEPAAYACMHVSGYAGDHQTCCPVLCTVDVAVAVALRLLQAWYLAGTLVLANTVAAVVVVLVAGSIAPTHATQEVCLTRERCCLLEQLLLLLRGVSVAADACACDAGNLQPSRTC